MRFYIDENLDNDFFVKSLRASGMELQTCRERGYRGTRDEIWIRTVSREGYIIVTADKRIRLNAAERLAILPRGSSACHFRTKSPSCSERAGESASTSSILDNRQATLGLSSLSLARRPTPPSAS